MVNFYSLLSFITFQGLISFIILGIFNKKGKCIFKHAMEFSILCFAVMFFSFLSAASLQTQENIMKNVAKESSAQVISKTVVDSELAKLIQPVTQKQTTIAPTTIAPTVQPTTVKPTEPTTIISTTIKPTEPPTEVPTNPPVIVTEPEYVEPVYTDPPYVEPVYEEEPQYYGGSVCWTPNGKSYHTRESCSTLSRSKTINWGSLDQAIALGKDDPCNVCAGG